MELIEKHDVETQEELADLLKKAGFVATQATVSRDIRELRLVKVSTGVRDGRIKPGQNILLAAIGGGLTWGAILLRF